MAVLNSLYATLARASPDSRSCDASCSAPAITSANLSEGLLGKFVRLSVDDALNALLSMHDWVRHTTQTYLRTMANAGRRARFAVIYGTPGEPAGARFLHPQGIPQRTAANICGVSLDNSGDDLILSRVALMQQGLGGDLDGAFSFREGILQMNGTRKNSGVLVSLMAGVNFRTASKIPIPLRFRFGRLPLSSCSPRPALQGLLRLMAIA